MRLYIFFKGNRAIGASAMSDDDDASFNTRRERYRISIGLDAYSSSFDALTYLEVCLSATEWQEAIVDRLSAFRIGMISMPL